MKKYIPLLYIPVMLIMIAKLNIEIDEAGKSMLLGFFRLGVLRYGIVLLEIIFYILLKQFNTPRYLVVFLLLLLAFPQVLWAISDKVLNVFPIEITYLFYGPYTFVGMTLLTIEILDLLKLKLMKD